MEEVQRRLNGHTVYNRVHLLELLLTAITESATAAPIQPTVSTDDFCEYTVQLPGEAVSIMLVYLPDAISYSYSHSLRSDTVVLHAATYTTWTVRKQYTVTPEHTVAGLVPVSALQRLSNVLLSRVFFPQVCFFRLPSDCLSVLYSYLSLSDLQSVSLVSYSAAAALQSQALWQSLYIARFGDPMFHLSTVDWRSAYRHTSNTAKKVG